LSSVSWKLQLWEVRRPVAEAEKRNLPNESTCYYYCIFHYYFNLWLTFIHMLTLPMLRQLDTDFLTQRLEFSLTWLGIWFVVDGMVSKQVYLWASLLSHCQSSFKHRYILTNPPPPRMVCDIPDLISYSCSQISKLCHIFNWQPFQTNFSCFGKNGWLY
jgi:hypothetical protein